MFGRRQSTPIETDDAIEILQPPFPLPIPLELRRSRRARRISLRIDMARSRVVLVSPHRVARRHALEFLGRQEAWLRARLAQLPASLPFADGATVPILGIPHRVVGDPTRLRGVVKRGEGIITIPGAPEHLPRRLTDYLKAEARREITARARIKAAATGRHFTALTLRDTRSRWGSCNSAGRLAFSWRLILAPDYVLDYVVAHEAAHLVEMNHSAAFWKLCASLTASDPKACRAWLKAHGAELHAYG
jgi:predicted metal-dependent hydrolase